MANVMISGPGIPPGIGFSTDYLAEVHRIFQTLDDTITVFFGEETPFFMPGPNSVSVCTAVEDGDTFDALKEHLNLRLPHISDVDFTHPDEWLIPRAMEGHAILKQIDAMLRFGEFQW